jgi:DNA mismatch endonuclease (patch repair protein)
MADTFSPATRSSVMARIRATGNKQTELRFVQILRGNGIAGWRRHQSIVGRPDFIFRREKVAVFVDGCFWHGCTKHGRSPTSNRAYWLPKLLRTKRRDSRNTKNLRILGWKVIRLWEHDLVSEDRIVRGLLRALRRDAFSARVRRGSPSRRHPPEANPREM